jgi:hypothetical protein
MYSKQLSVVKHSGARHASVGTVADVVVLLDGDRAREGSWWCLAGSWC